MKRLIHLLFLLALAAIVLGVILPVAVHRERGGRRGHHDRPSRHEVLFHRDAPHHRRAAFVAPEPEPEIREVAGRVSATEDRARDDARRELEARVAEWLEPQVPASWSPPADLVGRMIRETRVTPEEKDYGTVYTAALDADFGEARRAALVDAYRRDVARDRSLKLGALLGFLLICLAATTGYIRADEATKGYYTNRLRLASAAAVGAAGVILYRWLA